MSGTLITSGCLDTSKNIEEYSVSTFGRTTPVNDASGTNARLANWFIGAAPRPSGLDTLVDCRRVTSTDTSG